MTTGAPVAPAPAPPPPAEAPAGAAAPAAEVFVSGGDPRLARCGFAKLVGEKVDHIMRKYEITLGRRSKATNLDVVLGDFMSVSRNHARIYYNFETGERAAQRSPVSKL